MTLKLNELTKRICAGLDASGRSRVEENLRQLLRECDDGELVLETDENQNIRVRVPETERRTGAAPLFGH